MDRPRSQVPYIVLAVALVLSVLAVVLLVRGQRAGVPPQAGHAQSGGARPGEVPVPPAVPLNVGSEPVERTPEELLADAGVGVKAPDPAKLVEQIARALERGDLEQVTKLIGRDVLDDRALERLRQMAVEKPLRLQPQRPFAEVGELKLNSETRWSLNPEGAAEDQRIFIDLVKRADGWHVGRLVLPAAGEAAQGPVLGDALGIADAFIQSVMVQNFARAQGYVDSRKVSDAKIAALCILFEEGQYRLKRDKPLRAILVRADMVAYLANVEAVDGSRSAQFSLNLETEHAGEPRWRVADLNLDEMLSDYANRVAGGDIYYTPLVRNPAGGDTLVLYFGFDESGLSPRSARQLEIVAAVLRADPTKKLTISGHTDAKGADPYNSSLSERRAIAVKEFLGTRGVDPNQMQTRAVGANEPRRPNLLDDGSDNPEGRKVNRRTEIYLDF